MFMLRGVEVRWGLLHAVRRTHLYQHRLLLVAVVLPACLFALFGCGGVVLLGRRLNPPRVVAALQVFHGGEEDALDGLQP